MAKQIDTSGLSCPQPVLMFHQALKDGDRNMDVLVDNEASRENVTRAAKKQGLSVNPVEMENSLVKLEIRA